MLKQQKKFRLEKKVTIEQSVSIPPLLSSKKKGERTSACLSCELT